MLILYDSKTGNVQNFVDRLNMEAIKIPHTIEGLEIDQPFILITYTTGFGQVPASVDHFLEKNSHQLVGVAASGNKVWGANYGKSADTIANKYNVPILMKFELRGTAEDIDLFRERVQSIETH